MTTLREMTIQRIDDYTKDNADGDILFYRLYKFNFDKAHNEIIFITLVS